MRKPDEDPVRRDPAQDRKIACLKVNLNVCSQSEYHTLAVTSRVRFRGDGAGDRRDGRIRPAASRLPPTLGHDHPRWGMGAWVRGLRSATLCARAAPPPGSPPAHPARMDWQPLSKKKNIHPQPKQYICTCQNISLACAGCMASAVVEDLACGMVSMGSIPTKVQFCKNLEICISGTRVRILQGACW